MNSPRNINSRPCHPWKFSHHHDGGWVNISFQADRKTAAFIREMCTASGKTLGQVVEVTAGLISVFLGRRVITRREMHFIDVVSKHTGKSRRTVLTAIWKKVLPAVLSAVKVEP